MSNHSIWYRLPFLGRYFRWLDGDAPSGMADRYPIVKKDGTSSVPGIYIAGDLTGIPLLKFAADSGEKIVEQLSKDAAFIKERQDNQTGIVDLVIVGAGIAGISAALAARDKGLSYRIVESDKNFSTIHNFPTGKPIAAHPIDKRTRYLTIQGDTKEALISDLEKQISNTDLHVTTGHPVTAVTGPKGEFSVVTQTETILGRRVLLTVGKGGEYKKMGVTGEDKDNVFNRLIDPMAFKDKRILVVGGGDTAVESALLLARQKQNSVTLSYRGDTFKRPKPENITALEEAKKAGLLHILLNTKVEEIKDGVVVINDQKSGENILLKNDIVFVLIGKKLPLEFLQKSNVEIEGTWHPSKIIQFLALAFFAGMLYFGKKTPSFSGEALAENFLNAPSFFWDANWNKAIIGLTGWLSAIGFALFGTLSLGILVRQRRVALGSGWSSFKNIYFLAVALVIGWAYLSDKYVGQPLLGKSMGFFYTFFYSLTILTFGLRRILVKKDRYITLQTTSLIVVQVLFLFALPELILPAMGQAGLIHETIEQALFPGGSYWRSYGFILAWPLFFSNLMYGMPTTAWLVISLVQTFVIIPLMIRRWGKGAYCGWICSCGGLAETLGDEYRMLTPRGEKARGVENWGQVILAVVIVLSLWNLVAPTSMSAELNTAKTIYMIIVDILLAGAVGVGAYFFFSGRIWCRMFCPLAALMHLYTKFSRYRIFADKKKCISCGICTKMCHMGIDVMNYANKGRPMDNYECVRCSACVNECPMDCLSFGKTP